MFHYGELDILTPLAKDFLSVVDIFHPGAVDRFPNVELVNVVAEPVLNFATGVFLCSIGVAIEQELV